MVCFFYFVFRRLCCCQAALVAEPQPAVGLDGGVDGAVRDVVRAVWDARKDERVGGDKEAVRDSDREGSAYMTAGSGLGRTREEVGLGGYGSSEDDLYDVDLNVSSVSEGDVSGVTAGGLYAEIWRDAGLGSPMDVGDEGLCAEVGGQEGGVGDEGDEDGLGFGGWRAPRDDSRMASVGSGSLEGLGSLGSEGGFGDGCVGSSGGSRSSTESLRASGAQAPCADTGELVSAVQNLGWASEPVLGIGGSSVDDFHSVLEEPWGSTRTVGAATSTPVVVSAAARVLPWTGQWRSIHGGRLESELRSVSIVDVHMATVAYTPAGPQAVGARGPAVRGITPPPPYSVVVGLPHDGGRARLPGSASFGFLSPVGLRSFFQVRGLAFRQAVNRSLPLALAPARRLFGGGETARDVESQGE